MATPRFSAPAALPPQPPRPPSLGPLSWPLRSWPRARPSALALSAPPRARRTWKEEGGDALQLPTRPPSSPQPCPPRRPWHGPRLRPPSGHSRPRPLLRPCPARTQRRMQRRERQTGDPDCGRRRAPRRGHGPPRLPHEGPEHDRTGKEGRAWGVQGGQVVREWKGGGGRAARRASHSVKGGRY